MDDFLTRVEHEEFRKRLEDENNRQNHRIGKLEEVTQAIYDLAKTVEKLAANISYQAKEIEKQGTRLETLEARDGKMWRKVVGYCATAVVGGVITYVLTHIGL